MNELRVPGGHYDCAALCACIALMYTQNRDGYTTGPSIAVGLAMCLGMGAAFARNRRFKRANGLLIVEFGFGSRSFRDRVLPLWIVWILGYGLTIVGIVEAVDADRWALAVLVALGGGCVAALVRRRWMRVYQAERGDVVT